MYLQRVYDATRRHNYDCFGDVCGTVQSFWGTGGGNAPIVLMSYQETTGTLSPGAHAGSYNGQDAYNDMLVTQDANDYNEPQLYAHGRDHKRDGECPVRDGLQRPADGDGGRGGVKA